jgi:hypothetical protein
MQTTTQLKSKVRLVNTRDREDTITVDVKINANCPLPPHTIADIQDFFEAHGLGARSEAMIMSNKRWKFQQCWKNAEKSMNRCVGCVCECRLY